MSQSASPTIVIAALTYKRPEMLAAMLNSMLKLKRPAGWAVRFLIVDNDPEASARDTVEAAAEAFGGLLDYVVEPEPGIPSARNRAMREARDRGATLQCFLDDDGYADPNWLRELLTCRERSGAAIIGGPVRLLPPPFPISPWQRFLTRSVRAHDALHERRRAVHAASGRAEFGTGNWMADLDQVEELDVQFNTKLRFTGGEDTAFLNDLQAKGGKAAWCDRAVVFDQWQSDRIAVGYLFRRARAQGLTRICSNPEPAIRLLALQPIRIIIATALIVFPVLGMASFAAGLNTIGRAVGKLAFLWGAQSRLYARPSDETGETAASSAPHRHMIEP